MNTLLTTTLLLVALAGPLYAGELLKLDLDDATKIGTTITSDQKVKVEGDASVRIDTKHATTICLGIVEKPDAENTQLIYTAKVKCDIEGIAFLEMLAHVDGKSYFSKGMNNHVKGETDWKELSVPFTFLKGQKPEKVTLNIVINGKGTVWVDDIVLSTKQLDK